MLGERHNNTQTQTLTYCKHTRKEETTEVGTNQGRERTKGGSLCEDKTQEGKTFKIKQEKNWKYSHKKQ